MSKSSSKDGSDLRKPLKNSQSLLVKRDSLLLCESQRVGTLSQNTNFRWRLLVCEPKGKQSTHTNRRRLHSGLLICLIFLNITLYSLET